MAKKLRLNAEELRVDQFQVESAAAAIRGTVRGLETASTCWNTMYANSEPCHFCPNMPITYSCEDTSCC
jgi:hypothetical protein